MTLFGGAKTRQKVAVKNKGGEKERRYWSKMAELYNIGQSKNPLEPVHHGGLMGRSLDILRNMAAQKDCSSRTSEWERTEDEDIEKKQVDVEVGKVGTMNTGDIIDNVVELKENYKSQQIETPIIFNNGIYTIQKNLETSAVKIDPAFKALVDSVCHS